MFDIFLEGRAREIIRGLTSGLTPDIVQKLVDQDISLWSLIPEPMRIQLREQAGQKLSIIRDVDNEQVVKVVHRARPDLQSILETEQGKSWLASSVSELRSGLIASEVK